MYFLIYTSYAKATNEHKLKELLEQAREKNKACGITGMLLYLNGIFIQLIEGDKGRIKLLYETIRRDARHFSPVVLMEGEIKERFFEGWSMGFKAISAQQLIDEEGYRCLNPPNKENVQEVIRLFKVMFDHHIDYPAESRLKQI